MGPRPCGQPPCVGPALAGRPQAEPALQLVQIPQVFCLLCVYLCAHPRALGLLEGCPNTSAARAWFSLNHSKWNSRSVHATPSALSHFFTLSSPRGICCLPERQYQSLPKFAKLWTWASTLRPFSLLPSTSSPPSLHTAAVPTAQCRTASFWMWQPLSCLNLSLTLLRNRFPSAHLTHQIPRLLSNETL